MRVTCGHWLRVPHNAVLLAVIGLGYPIMRCYLRSLVEGTP